MKSLSVLRCVEQHKHLDLDPSTKWPRNCRQFPGIKPSRFVHYVEVGLKEGGGCQESPRSDLLRPASLRTFARWDLIFRAAVGRCWLCHHRCIGIRLGGVWLGA